MQGALARAVGVGTAFLAATLIAGCQGTSSALADASSTTSQRTPTSGQAGAPNLAPPTPAPPTQVGPTSLTSSIRPDIFTGTSVPPVSLQDNAQHRYRFAGSPGTEYDVAIDTSPSGSLLYLDMRESTDITVGSSILFSGFVTTPFTTTLSASRDSAMNILVWDSKQANLTLSKLTVMPRGARFAATSLQVMVHLAGDSFAGFGAFNDLQTAADQQAFYGDLISGVNGIYAQTGMQIDTGRSGFRKLTNAQVRAIDSRLVGRNGFTVVDLQGGQPFGLWGNAGMSATDPQFSRAIDIFLVHDALPPGLLGVSFCLTTDDFFGGTALGNGANHGLVQALFPLGLRRNMAELKTTVAHELGHFLGLRHTTEGDFEHDDLPDTPEALDTNGNGFLEDVDGPPDIANVMFPYAIPGVTQTTFSRDQANALKGYLSIKDH